MNIMFLLYPSPLENVKLLYKKLHGKTEVKMSSEACINMKIGQKKYNEIHNPIITLENLIKIIGEIPFCDDNCGLKVNIHPDKRGSYKNYLKSGYPKHIVGHNKPTLGKKIHSEKRKQEMSKFFKEFNSRPEVKERLSRNSSEYQNRPEIKAKTTAKFIEINNRPEIKEATSKRQSEIMNDPIHKEFMRNISIKNWENQEFKEMMQKVSSDYQNRPEVKEKLIQRNIENWQDQEYRENQIERMKELWKNPEYRDKILNSENNMRNSEETRTKVSASQLGILNHRYGKHISEENSKLLSIRMSGSGNNMYNKSVPIGAGWGNGDYHLTPNQGIVWMRSTWEIKFTNFLESRHIDYYYEYKRFKMNIGYDTTYAPDFYLPEYNTYIEVKGYWDEKTDAKLKSEKFIELYSKDYNYKVLMKKELQELGIL